MDDSLSVLTSGPADRPDRQLTLHSAFDWSHRLLDPSRRALFRRLGIFRDGFTVDAAEAVVGGSLSGKVLAVLPALVESSLVVRPTEQGRYSMLEPIREFALAKLDEEGESDETVRQHAGYCLDLVKAAKRQLARAEQVRWLATLQAEHANLLAALRWTHDSGHVDTALDIAGRMWRFWQLRGHLSEDDPVWRPFWERRETIPAFPGSRRSSGGAVSATTKVTGMVPRRRTV